MDISIFKGQIIDYFLVILASTHLLMVVTCCTIIKIGQYIVLRNGSVLLRNDPLP